jgi:hypothetical protein
LGAGPYGLSAAAHLRNIKGLEVRVFGEPMEFWKCQMPEGMFLRSPWAASHLSDPAAARTFDHFRQATGADVPVPIPLDQFVRYGLWFQKQAVGDVDRRRIHRIDRDPKGFRLTLNDGESHTTRRVVVASGIGPFATRPAPLRNLPQHYVTHSSDQREIGQFKGKRVAVVGAGQSALESAALIHEAGGTVEVIARTPAIHWLGWRQRMEKFGPLANLFYSRFDIGPAGVSRIVAYPPMVKYFPRGTQTWFRTRALRPAGSRWLIERLKDVPKSTGRQIASASETGSQVQLTLDDGSTRQVDHVFCGTGYRVNISQYAFLPEALSNSVRTANGFPLLGSGFESSVPGLHFIGAPAAWTYGPLMYFVAGTDFAAKAVGNHFARSRPGPAK